MKNIVKSYVKTWVTRFQMVVFVGVETAYTLHDSRSNCFWIMSKPAAVVGRRSSHGPPQ